MGKRCYTIALFAVLAAGCSGNSPTAPAKNSEFLTPVVAAPAPTRSSTFARLAAAARSSEVAAPAATPQRSSAAASLGETLCQSAVNGVTCFVQTFTETGARVLFTNGSTQPVAVNLSVYLRFEPDGFATQVFHAEGSARVESLASGQSTVLEAFFPPCSFQIDAYVGPQVQTPPHAPEVLLGYEHGGTTLCENPVIPEPDPTPGLDGCTPGFWTNHPDGWPAPYAPNTALNSVFTAAPPGVTLMRALEYGGSDATRKLLRHAVAALLNIAHPDVDWFPITVTEFVDLVNGYLVPGVSDQDKLTVKDVLDTLNNSGCPINGRPGS